MISLWPNLPYLLDPCKGVARCSTGQDQNLSTFFVVIFTQKLHWEEWSCKRGDKWVVTKTKTKKKNWSLEPDARAWWWSVVVGYAPSPRQQQQRRRRRREEPIPAPLAETKYRVNITLSYRRPALQCIAHLVQKEAGTFTLFSVFSFFSFPPSLIISSVYAHISLFLITSHFLLSEKKNA